MKKAKETQKKRKAPPVAFALALAAMFSVPTAAYDLQNKFVGDIRTVEEYLPIEQALDCAETVTAICLGRTLYRSEPLLINSNTYLPAEEFFAAMGCECGTVTVSDGGYTVEANGRTVFCPTPAFTLPRGYIDFAHVDGHTHDDGNTHDDGHVIDDAHDDEILCIPARAAAQLAGCEVRWDGGSATAYFTSPRSEVAAGEDVYYPSDLLWLSRIIESESGGEPFIGKLAVANVVLNRIASDSFPNDMYSVIFDRRFGVQFTPTANGMIYRTPSEESIRAAKAALEGYTLSTEALYFIAPSAASNFWVARNRPYLFTVRSHDFYG